MKYKRRKLSIIPPFVAMADIAFNLVLFFLILAKTQDKTELQWEPVKATGIKQVGNAKVSITVDKDDKVYLNGEQIGLRDLADKVAKELEGKAPTERLVLLKIHKDTLAKTFEPIIDAVSQAGGELVHVLEEEQPG